MQKPEYRPYSYTVTQMVLAILLSFLLFIILGMLAMATIASLWPETGGITDNLADLILMNTPHLVLFAAVALSARWLLHTPLGMLATDRPHFSWRLVLLSFLSSLLILAVVNIPLIFFQDVHYLSGSWPKRLLLLPFILVLVPLQTAAEELFFRVLPARLVYRGRMETEYGHMLLLSAVSGLLFVLPHLSANEMELVDNVPALLTYYFLFGFAAMYISLYTRGFECAFGTHAAINMFTALILGYEGGSLVTAPLFMMDEMVDPFYDNIALAILFIFVIFTVTQAAKRGFLGDNKVEREEENG